MSGRFKRGYNAMRAVLGGAARGAERTTIRAGHAVEDVTPTHAAHIWAIVTSAVYPLHVHIW